MVVGDTLKNVRGKKFLFRIIGTGITEKKVKKFNCTITLQFTHIYIKYRKMKMKMKMKIRFQISRICSNC